MDDVDICAFVNILYSPIKKEIVLGEKMKKV
jgi:hypothetical protein